MDAKLFLEYLPWLRQPTYLSKMLGLSANYDEWLIKDTTPVRRTNPIKLLDAPTSIQMLFAENSLENLHFINGISFWSEPKPLEQGWGFADMSEVNLHRARLLALLANRAVVGNITELGEMLQRNTAARLLFVQECFQQE